MLVLMRWVSCLGFGSEVGMGSGCSGLHICLDFFPRLGIYLICIKYVIYIYVCVCVCVLISSNASCRHSSLVSCLIADHLCCFCTTRREKNNTRGTQYFPSQSFDSHTLVFREWLDCSASTPEMIEIFNFASTSYNAKMHHVRTNAVLMQSIQHSSMLHPSFPSIVTHSSST